jgi:hypothetical protein
MKTFFGECDVTDFALAQPDRKGSAVGVECAHLEARQFGIATPGQQGCLHESSKIAAAAN